MLATPSTRLRFPHEWPLGEDGWTLAGVGDDPEGPTVIVAGNGGALRLISGR